MTQPSLDFDGGAHCDECFATMERLCAQFEADVRAGKFDAHGYTPAERKKQQRNAA